MSESASKIIARQIRENGLPEPVREHQFHSKRKWRFDFAWPEHRLAFEVEGGAFSRGRHTRPKGFTEDIFKYNEAGLLGWLVIRATTKQIQSGQAIEWVVRHFSD